MTRVIIHTAYCYYNADNKSTFKIKKNSLQLFYRFILNIGRSYGDGACPWTIVMDNIPNIKRGNNSTKNLWKKEERNLCQELR